MAKDTMTAEERLNATIDLQPVDRVVCAPMIDQYAGQFAGMTNKEFMWNWDKTMEAIDKVHDAYPIWDSNPFIMSERVPPFIQTIGLMKTKLPGTELPDNSSFQMIEFEAMTRDDYDIIMKEGLVPYAIKFWTIAHGSTPEQIMEALPKKGAIQADEIARTIKRGQSPTWAVLGGSGPDLFSMCRSMEKFFKDIFQIPDKMAEILLKASDEWVNFISSLADAAGIRRSFLGDARSSNQFISLKTFDEILFPAMKRLINGLIDKDIIPILHYDSDWTNNLEYFLQFPAKKFVLQLDGATDIFRAKEVLKGHCAIMGDVPAALLALGSPTEVDEYAKKLIKEVGKDWGYIYSSGCCVPMNAKHENMKAFFNAVDKYGRYD